MYMFINALIMALLVPAGAEQKAHVGPACDAELKGRQLLTRVEMPTGMTVEGPWRVMYRGDVRDGEKHYIMFAELDRLIEHDELTGQRRVIAFPEPVRLAFEGNDQGALIQQAAQTWCVTVLRAQQNEAFHQIGPNQQLTRITSLPAARPDAA